MSQQDPPCHRRAGSSPGPHTRRRHRDRSFGLRRRCARDRAGSGYAGDDRTGAADHAGRCLPWGFPGGTGNRSHPRVQQLAHGRAPPVPQHSHRDAGSARGHGARGPGVPVSRQMAADCAVRPQRPRTHAQRVGSQRSDSRSRGAPRGSDAGIPGRRPGRRTDPRRVACGATSTERSRRRRFERDRAVTCERWRRRRARAGRRGADEFDLRAAVREHEWRRRAGIFQRRNHRRHHHGFEQGLRAVRDRTQHGVHVQGQKRGRAADRATVAASVTFSKAACARRAAGCASPRS